MKKVQVLGPFHSGTNLLINMLTENCRDLEKPEDHVNVSENMFLWKHTFRMLDLDSIIKKNKDHVVIVIYKHLYNWLMSMAFDPIDVKMSRGFIGKCSMLNLEFENLVDMYNRHYSIYKWLVERHPRQVVVVDYYKMIQKDTGYSYMNSQLEKVGLGIVDKEKVIQKLGCSSRLMSVANSSEAVDKYPYVQETIRKTIGAYPGLVSSIDQNLIDYFEKF